MTTATEIIDRAYSLIGYKDASESVTGQDAALALEVLNDLIDSWNTQNNFIVSVNEVVTTVSGSSVSIGPGQTINVPRPVDVMNGSFIRINNVDFMIDWISREEYNSIPYKLVTSNVVVYGYYDQNLPVGHIYLWPVPSSAELHLQLMSQLEAFADLTTPYDLAPGYKLALQYTLAEELAPGLKELPPSFTRKAAAARRAIRRTNVSVPLLANAGRQMSPYGKFLSGV